MDAKTIILAIIMIIILYIFDIMNLYRIIDGIFIFVNINSSISCFAVLLTRELTMLAGVNNRIITESDMNKASMPVAILINMTSKNNIAMDIDLDMIAVMTPLILNFRLSSNFNKAFILNHHLKVGLWMFLC